MSNIRKKELVREYKERKPRQGIFAVRCAASDEMWIASSHNLDKQQNRIWFALRQNGQPNKNMQAAWNAHGETSFAYEILEEVTDENPLLVDSLLKERALHWRTKLAAQPVVA